MNKILLGFSVLLFCAAAQGLVCNVCKFKMGKLCLNTEEPCKAKPGEFCETTRVYSGTLNLFTKYGCSSMPELCNKTEQRDNIFDVSYNRTCCSNDLCNGGIINNPSLPFLSGLTLALGWWLFH
ncbi:lymphocyte antigen 6 complex locus protein G6c [Tiliqua scincoides]|uniref:lymphocyte antigen 6 complex locus protein G6c n=1 Tax=Tiliqua scincoides TaxID=71010 RepID=UPI00346284BC